MNRYWNYSFQLL